MKLSKHLGGGKLGLGRYFFRFQQIRIAEPVVVCNRHKAVLEITRSQLIDC